MSFFIRWLIAVAIATVIAKNQAQTLPRVLYQTGFEAAEGYDIRYELAGQKNWFLDGTGGNGLMTEQIAGFGQQAFIGFFPPTDTNDVTSVWRPLDFAPAPAGVSVVSFSVKQQIVGSTFNRNDTFRWSVYNTNGFRLFSLDFDTADRRIYFGLDDGFFTFTNFQFETNGTYDLEIKMNFAKNLWTATLNDVVIVSSQKITTKNRGLHLGDIDAVWLLGTAGFPGNNYMVFDNYRIVAEADKSIPPQFEAIGVQANDEFYFNFFGEPGRTYTIEVSSDLKQWFFLGDFIMPEGGSFEFQDDTAPGHPISLYRAVLVE